MGYYKKSGRHIQGNIPSMDSEKKIVVNIVNRNYPPSKGITGESAAELAKYFCETGFRVNIIHIDAPYSGGGNEFVPIAYVHKVKTFYNGKNKYVRLLANLLEGYLLFRKSKKVSCDVTICMTDPPLLNMWASLLLRKRKWILWAMDLYPEAFLSGKLVSSTNFLYKKINTWTKKGIPQHIISLGPIQAEYLQKSYSNRVTNFSCLPCGVYGTKNKVVSDIPKWATDTHKIYLGYCGNLGEAHSLEFLFSIIDNFNADRFKLILAAYGSKALLLKKYAAGKRGVEIVDSIKRSHLRFIDIHLASLSKKWTNICVPSKTVSSVCAGSTFLYYGDKYSDNWFLLQEAGWLIPCDNNVKEGVKTFFSTFQIGELERKKEAAQKIATKLNIEKEKTFQEIVNKIRKIAS
jgi:hypothetical protein